MKYIKFSEMFLVFAWIYFFAAGKSVASGMLLVLSGLYALCDAVPKLWRGAKKHAKR